MRNVRKGTREVYVKPYRLSYYFNKKENLIIFLDFYMNNKYLLIFLHFFPVILFHILSNIIRLGFILNMHVDMSKLFTKFEKFFIVFITF